MFSGAAMSCGEAARTVQLSHCQWMWMEKTKIFKEGLLFQIVTDAAQADRLQRQCGEECTTLAVVTSALHSRPGFSEMDARQPGHKRLAVYSDGGQVLPSL